MSAYLGPHAVFIVLSYAAAALVVATLVAWVGLDHRRLNRKLAELERRGIRRRSATAGEATARPSASGSEMRS